MACRILSLAFAFTFCLASLVRAQTSQDIDRSQLFRTEPGLNLGQQPNANGEALGYAAPTPNDADLGVQAVLKRQDEYKPFSISVATPIYYTSNVALSRVNEHGDEVFAPELTLTYQPRITKTFYGEFMVVQQLFYYAHYGSFNFTSLDAIAGVVYYVPQLSNLTLRVRYDFTRLTNEHFDEFFQNHSFIFNAELPLRFGRAMQLTLGLVADISFAATPDAPQRDEYDAYADYQVLVTRALSIDAAARFLFKNYHETDREDISEILSLSANYRIRVWLSVSALATYALNQSNHPVFDYKVGNLGGALALVIKF